MKFLPSLLFALLLLTRATLATNLVTGTSAEFSGPDDLMLDPATSVIAVNTYGSDTSLEVNGVTFQSAGLVAGTETVSNGGVTVTTTAGFQIDGWVNATPPDYTGADATSTDNLERIMHDIRWSLGSGANGPTTVNIDVTGLTDGTLYNVQLLFGENGAAANRRWDIAVDGVLAIDDWTSNGDGGTSSLNHGYAYSADFDPGVDGTLNIIMGTDPFPADPNNTAAGAAPPEDHNPILQAVIIHRAAGPTAPTEILVDNDKFLPSAPTGSVIGLLSSVDSNPLDTHSYTLIAGAGDTDNSLFQLNATELQTNSDFSAAADGTTFSIRVRSTDNGGLSFEQTLTLTTGDDTDLDRLADTWEMTFRPNPGDLGDLTGLKSGPGPGRDSGDFDNDGSPDLEEFANETDPTDQDSDDDGSRDDQEVANMTDPNDDDSDDDGLNDGDEATATSDPNNPDTDGDTIPDGLEVTNGTSPILADSDEDGVNDNLDFAPLDPKISSATTVFVGEIIEFNGPDDLNLDPTKSVIAVSLSSDFDLDVNGVTFLGDGIAAGSGSATSGDVTVTTTAANQITAWATPPTFTGADATSTDNLETIMTGIRYETAPAPVAVDISGLTVGASYEIQLLVNEGANHNRQWDIGVGGELVVDNFTSEGFESVQTWTAENSFAYVGEFNAPPGGILNIVMQQHIGGLDPRGADNNPILQAVIVHRVADAAPPKIISLVQDSESGLWTLTWESNPGTNYALDYSIDLQSINGGSTWIEIEDTISATAETTTFEDPFDRAPFRGFYRLRTPE
ncbi:MAG: hypothetical protein ACI8XO_000738 [Verrucomicrobiales bacterium]|jgi:hypothetical protein